MFSKHSGKIIDLQINLVLLWLAALLLTIAVHYVTRRILNGEIRFSLLLSLLVAGIWMFLSLSGFLYVTPASLLGFGVSGAWPWLKYTVLLFVILLVVGRYLVLQPWGVAAASAAIPSAIWFFGLCFGKALGAVK